MRRISLISSCLLGLFAAAQVQALGFNHRDDNDGFNRYYSGSEPAKFQESELALPDFPNEQTEWLEIEAENHPAKDVLIDKASIAAAPDRSVRYTVNIRSKHGHDNISAEALYCSAGTLISNKNSSYKIYAYGDTVNRRWIKSRNPQWQDLGGTFDSGHPVRAALYKAWCIDGLPSDEAGLIRRLKERAGHFHPSRREAVR